MKGAFSEGVGLDLANYRDWASSVLIVPSFSRGKFHGLGGVRDDRIFRPFGFLSIFKSSGCSGQ